MNFATPPPPHFTDKTEDTMTLDSRKKDSNSVLQFFFISMEGVK